MDEPSPMTSLATTPASGLTGMALAGYFVAQDRSHAPAPPLLPFRSRDLGPNGTASAAILARRDLLTKAIKDA